FSIPEERQQELHYRLWNLPVPDCLEPAWRQLEEGNPAEEILRVARMIDADLIVIGTHARKSVNFSQESVTEKVARQACCPVLTAAQGISSTARLWQHRVNQVPSLR